MIHHNVPFFEFSKFWNTVGSLFGVFGGIIFILLLSFGKTTWYPISASFSGSSWILLKKQDGIIHFTILSSVSPVMWYNFSEISRQKSTFSKYWRTRLISSTILISWPAFVSTVFAFSIFVKFLIFSIYFFVFAIMRFLSTIGLHHVCRGLVHLQV